MVTFLNHKILTLIFGSQKCVFPKCTFLGPNWVGGAWYGIFLIREKPALRAGLIMIIIQYITLYVWHVTSFAIVFILQLPSDQLRCCAAVSGLMDIWALATNSDLEVILVLIAILDLRRRLVCTKHILFQSSCHLLFLF